METKNACKRKGAVYLRELTLEDIRDALKSITDAGYKLNIDEENWRIHCWRQRGINFNKPEKVQFT